ncbi:MAG: tetratricopeptide repeat protein [Victivallales bacterium]|nr:tetratricopeptide repeat protein [Victivallales bacterium]
MKRPEPTLILSLLILAVGVGLRWLYLEQYAASPLFVRAVGPDVSDYLAWARRILVGQWCWDRVHIHAPLYPYGLAGLYYLVSGRLDLVRLWQLLAGLAAMVPLFCVWRRRAPRTGIFHWTPYLYLLLAAVYPPLWYYEGEIISEALLVPLVTLALWALLKADGYGFSRRAWYWRSIGGVLTGLAIITHPLAGGFAVMEGVLLLWQCGRHRSRHGRRRAAWFQLAGFALGVLLPVLPVGSYNYRLEGRLVPIQKNSAYNLFLGNNPAATGGCYIWPGPDWDRIHETVAREAARRGISPDTYFLEQAGQFIRRHPLAWLQLELRKAGYVWNWREAAAGPDLPQLKYFTPLQRHTAWAFGLAAVLALTAIAAGSRNRRFLWSHRQELVLILSVWGALTLTVVGGRYRLMMLAPVLYFAAYGALLWCDRIRQRRWRGIALTTAIAAVMVFWPRMPGDAAAESAQADTILGEAWLAAGDLSRAETHLAAAIRQQPDWARNYNLLGQIYAKKNDFERAADCYRRATLVEPRNPYGYMNMGNLASQSGDPAAAEADYEQALALAPHNPQVLYNLASFHLERGHGAAAEALLRRCLVEQPDHREALNSLGVIAFRSERFDVAGEWFARAVRLEPDNPDLQLNLALVRAASGRTREAKEMLHAILRRWPEHRGARQLQRELTPARQP